MCEMLTERDRSERYYCLSSENRKAVLEILRQTEPNLPAWFQAAANP
jgi:hypothetical protein